MNRRSFLVASVSAGVTLAGCAGDSEDGSAGASGATGDATSTETATPDDSPTLDTHPSAIALQAQPTLGPDPGEATAVIVAYEDPSCPRCASFETATRALEAAYDRSTEAHWALAEHYFESQADFRYGDLSEVYPKTATFLDEATDIDAGQAALAGVDIAFVTYHLREHGLSVKEGGGSAAGVVLGVLGAGCAACGSAILVGHLSLVGATGLLTLLPFEGLEFTALAVGVLVLSMYWLADGMRGGEIRSCPVGVGG